MTGRPPTTAQGRVRAIVKRMQGVHGAIAPRDRYRAMHALMGNVHRGFGSGSDPELHDLEALAAHALAWAEEIEQVRTTKGKKW